MLADVLPDKKEGLAADDVKYVTATMLAQAHVLDMVEALVAINSRPLRYKASQIQLRPLTLSFNALDTELFHAYQLEMLRFTVLLLLHLESYFASTSERLRHIAAQCVCLGVAENVEGCRLMKRVFPKELFGKQENVFKWDLEDWKLFLEKAKKGFNGPTQQWNIECREELVAKLRSAIRKYLAHKRLVKAADRFKSLLWNISEFSVTYSTLHAKCRVGDFYLLHIITQSTNENGKAVSEVTEAVPQPSVFWKVARGVIGRSW